MNWVLALIGLLSFSIGVFAADASLSYSLQPVFNRYKNDSLVALPNSFINQPDSYSSQILELTATTVNLSFTATAKNTITEGEEASNKAILKELVYSTTLADWDISVGRKISSWGVGLAYRPLDVVQREDLLSSEQETLKGINQLALERYGISSSIGFYWINPGQDDKETGAEQSAAISRYTHTGENADWQALLRYSDQHSLQVGAGISYIATDAIELHASALYYPYYHRRLHVLAGQEETLLASSDPWQDIEFRDGINWLLGGNYTWGEKHNLIFEYWHDDIALSQSQWQDQFDLMFAQNALLNTAMPTDAVYGNLAWSGEALRNEHLIQDNLFLRYQYQGDSLIPQASLLYSPADSGYRLSTELLLDRYSIKYNAGARYYQGDSQSVYGQVPYSAQLYFTVYGDF